MIRIVFLLSVITVIGILYFEHDIYWRPYNDTGQESLASIHAHGFAIANLGGLSKNPVIARDIDVENGKIKEYNHWPNGFFITLAVCIKLFGNTEVVGRSVALLYAITGLYLMAFAFKGKSGLSYLMVPVIMSTPIGRNCISFVFVDAALLFWIGFIAMAVSLRNKGSLFPTLTFRIGVILSPFFIQTIAPFAFFGACARYICDHKNKKVFFYDLLCVFGALAIVMVFLSWTSNGILSGAKELLEQFLHRASIKMRYQESVSFKDLLGIIKHHYYMNFGVLSILVPLTYLILLKNKAAQSFLLLAVFIYSLLLRNYVGVHIFANLPLISISLFTIANGIELVPMTESFAARAYVAAIILSTILFRNNYNYYILDKNVEAQINSFRRIKPELLNTNYNAFHVHDGDNWRIPQMFCGERIIRGIVNAEKKNPGIINLQKLTVTGAE